MDLENLLEIRLMCAKVVASFTTLGFFPFFVNHVSIPLFDNHISSNDQCLFGIIQIPTCFYNLLPWIIRFLGQWVNDIGLHYFSA